MLTVRIQGGLGNQMFQYAYARKMQLDGHVVDMHWHPPKRKSLHTGYSLDSVFSSQLKKNVPLANDSPLSPILDTLKRKLSRIRQGNNVGYDPVFMELKSGYIDGYFQSELYFSDIADVIKSELSFPEISGLKNEDICSWIDDHFVIAVHIRGGDYLNRGAMSGDMATVCGPEYYSKAIAEMQSRFPDGQFLVFSDDFEYASLVMGDRGFKRVDWNVGSNSWKDMALMSKCNAHVTANSSFSWWGTWLSNSELRIMPSPWFPPFADTYNKDIFIENSFIIEQSSELNG